jgi:hypothetical protein
MYKKIAITVKLTLNTYKHLKKATIRMEREDLFGTPLKKFLVFKCIVSTV